MLYIRLLISSRKVAFVIGASLEYPGWYMPCISISNPPGLTDVVINYIETTFCLITLATLHHFATTSVIHHRFLPDLFTFHTVNMLFKSIIFIHAS